MLFTSHTTDWRNRRTEVPAVVVDICVTNQGALYGDDARGSGLWGFGSPAVLARQSPVHVWSAAQRLVCVWCGPVCCMRTRGLGVAAQLLCQPAFYKGQHLRPGPLRFQYSTIPTTIVKKHGHTVSSVLVDLREFHQCSA